MEGCGRSAQARAEIDADAQNVANNAKNVDARSSIEHNTFDNIFNKRHFSKRRRVQAPLRDGVVESLNENINFIQIGITDGKAKKLFNFLTGYR
jgi:hypothetical protein